MNYYWFQADHGYTETRRWRLPRGVCPDCGFYGRWYQDIPEYPVDQAERLLAASQLQVDIKDLASPLEWQEWEWDRFGELTRTLEDAIPQFGRLRSQARLGPLRVKVVIRSLAVASNPAENIICRQDAADALASRFGDRIQFFDVELTNAKPKDSKRFEIVPTAKCHYADSSGVHICPTCSGLKFLRHEDFDFDRIDGQALVAHPPVAEMDFNSRMRLVSEEFRNVMLEIKAKHLVFKPVTIDWP